MPVVGSHICPGRHITFVQCASGTHWPVDGSQVLPCRQRTAAQRSRRQVPLIGSQTCPGGHAAPLAQVIGVHWPVAGSQVLPIGQRTPLQSGQASNVHAAPWGAQIPQLGLQQYIPAMQVFLPQVTGPGTHWPLTGSQVWSDLHCVFAHGLAHSRISQPQLPSARRKQRPVGPATVPSGHV